MWRCIKKVGLNKSEIQIHFRLDYAAVIKRNQDHELKLSNRFCMSRGDDCQGNSVIHVNVTHLSVTFLVSVITQSNKGTADSHRDMGEKIKSESGQKKKEARFHLKQYTVTCIFRTERETGNQMNRPFSQVTV